MFPTEVYKNRRNSLKSKIGKGILLFPGNTELAWNYKSNTSRFRQDSTFLYFFGIDIPNLFAVINLDNDEEIVFGDDVDLEDIIWTGSVESIADLANKAGATKTLKISQLDSYIQNANRTGQTLHFLPCYRSETKLLLSELTGIKHSELSKSVSHLFIEAVVALRSKKDNLEIDDIENMVNLAGVMHTTAMTMAKQGISEHEIAGIVEGICLQKGYAVSFPVICSVRGEILHNISYNNTLQNGQLLLTDAGAESMNHYASDITRTTPVGGKFSTQQKAIYQIVLSANKKVIELAKPGILYRDIHLQAAQVIADGLCELGLMKGNSEEAVKAGAHALFFPHGIGHMLGLDVHDMENLGENNVGYNNTIIRSEQFGLAYLRMARTLDPGFVVTDEPGIYFIPELIGLWKSENKFTQFINYDEVAKYIKLGGIRIEDDLFITPSGCKVLGNPIPKEIKDIEDLCS